MAISIKSEREIELMKEAGRILALTHEELKKAIKPGITGLWQVSGRSNITDFDEVVRLDRKYIDEWSLVNDIKILFKTVGVVLKGEGSM